MSVRDNNHDFSSGSETQNPASKLCALAQKDDGVGPKNQLWSPDAKNPPNGEKSGDSVYITERETKSSAPWKQRENSA